MTRFWLRLFVAAALAALGTLLCARLWLEPTSDDITLELLRGHASALATEFAHVPPIDRASLAQRKTNELGYPVLLEEARRKGTVRTRWRGGKLFVVTPVPGTPGQLVLGPLPHPRTRAWTPAIALALLLCAIATTIAAWPLFRRVREQNLIASQLARGNFSVRTATERGGVLDPIGRALNRLADRMNQVLTDERDLLRTVAHEVRAPIARMRFRVEKILRRANADLEKDCTGLDSDLQQVNALFEELLTYVAFDEFDHERPDLQPEAISVYDAVRNVVGAVTVTEEHVDVTLHRPKDNPTVYANPKLFDRAVTNLLLNAIAYGGDAVQIYIRTFEREVIVDVQDQGPGIPASERPKVVRPFVRLANKKTRGTGLGLAIVTRIMALHGGRLHIVDAPSGGASIQLVWSRAPLPKPLKSRT